MGSSFEDLVVDFDLNFLSQSSNVVNDSRVDKQRQSILKLKRRVTSVNFVVNKYHETKEQLAQSEVLLLAAKEECKQVCIDYKDTIEKCAQLEKNVKLFQERNRELERNCEMTQNRLNGMESHANQLQILVAENETVIEDLRNQNQSDKSNVKEYEKKLLTLQKENETLLKNLCLARAIALGKKKLRKHHKVLLQQYDNQLVNVEDSSSGSSDEDTDLLESSPPSPIFTPIKDCNEERKNKKVSINIKTDDICVLKKDQVKNSDDHDSDFSNEVVSEDTGRGSSLAFSEGDKFFNSPDYYISDCPFIPECNKTKEKRVLADACTSPIIVNETVHTATSPLIFDNEALLSHNVISPNNEDSNMEYITDIPFSAKIVTTNEKKSLVDVGTNTDNEDIKVNVSTSPVVFKPITEKTCIDMSTSPILSIEKSNTGIISSPQENIASISNLTNGVLVDILPSTEKRHATISDLSSQCELEISGKLNEERKCLERNNSKNLCDESTNDNEIEMILNTMRLNDRLITPIPNTPMKLSKNSSNSPKSTHELTNRTEVHTACKEAKILREENQILHRSIEDLTKDMLTIKRILKKQKLMPESPEKHSPENSFNAEICNNSTEEILSIEIDEDSEISINKKCETPRSTDVQNENIQCEKEDRNGMEIEQTSNTLTDQTEFEICDPGDNCDVSLVENNVEENVTDENCVGDTVALETGNNKEIISEQNKKAKCKKLSRLDKLRIKLLPKSKIKGISLPIRKLQTKSKLKPVSNSKEAEMLLNKLAHENARKIMEELKLKESNRNKEVNRFIETPEITNTSNEFNNNDIVSKQKLTESLKSYSPIKDSFHIRQPILCLTPVNLDNVSQKEKHKNNNELKSSRNSEVIVPSKDDKLRIGEHKSLKQSKNIVSPKHDTKNNKPKSPQKSDTTIPKETTPRRRELSNRSPRRNDTTKENVPKRVFNTRSRSKFNQEPATLIKFDNNRNMLAEGESDSDTPIESRILLKRVSSESLPTECKRVLRSQHVRQMFIDHGLQGNEDIIDTEKNKNVPNDLLFSSSQDNSETSNDVSLTKNLPEHSILCNMLQKYGRAKVKINPKKVSDDISNSICKNLEKSIKEIIELPVGEKSKLAMVKLVEEIQRNWNLKNFLTGLMKYLKDPERKQELFTKVSAPPAPPMTKSEQVLLFIIKQLQVSLPNLVNTFLTQVEFSLFQLNRTPEFDVIESVSHFYALVCRYFGLKNRLRLFILDAMYCLQFKVVPLIKQCLEVWMHILPLAHMGVAKSPLVTCLVYLLHFYKCEDKYNRIQDIRFTLSKKYFYQITEWNEAKILEMFKNSIKELREINIEKKMLRMAFIILAKRQGPKWCQKNIIKNMLIPIIESENESLRIRQFCVELLGPLLKPYPMDMKVHCEIIVNQLLDMLDQTTLDPMKEAIFTSLIFMNKHNQNRVIQSLLSWRPKRVTPEFEELIRDFIQEKPVKAWKRILSRIAL